MGRDRTRWLFATLVMSALPLGYLAIAIPGRESLGWSVMVLLPLLLYLVGLIYRLPPGRALNRLLVMTARVQLLYAVVLMIGVMI